MTTRSSQKWWAETKANEGKLIAWLFDQYRGEATAGSRIEQLRDAWAEKGTRAWKVLSVVARQERTHAVWVGELLRARGVEPRIDEKSSRYWKKTLAGIKDLATGCAVGAHAERMRLERIEVIAGDAEGPADVRAVFGRILPEERFHERAFRSLAGPEAMVATAKNHYLGREALGLSP